MTKPFGIDELLARIRAVTRRRGRPDGAGSADRRLGTWRVDLADRRVTGDGGEVQLTPTEWQLLEALVRNPGKLIGQRQLLTEVWGPATTERHLLLRQYLTRLRRKLEADPSRPEHLLTEPGMGYRFQP